MQICAIYARVSDESQVKGDSIHHQIGFCQEVARRRSVETGVPWDTPVAYTYVDEGLSGTTLVQRLQAQRLICDARAGRFNVVLFKGISRFARDTVDALIMLRTLMSCNVRVISVEENFDSQRDHAEFVFTIHSALAQAESEKTAVRVRMGALQKARDGKWNGMPPDGYILNRTTKRLEIDEGYAPVIRRIFQLYLQGMGTPAIAMTLNQSGERTKHSAVWTARTVARILRNPAYVGDVVYGRRERTRLTYGEEGPYARKKTTRLVDDDGRVVTHPDAHPAIVSRNMFQQAADIMAKRRAQPGRSGRLHLLSGGILRCRCGGRMRIKYNGRGTAYYRCVKQEANGRHACAQGYLRADEVEEAVLANVRVELDRLLEVVELPHRVQAVASAEQQVRDAKQRLETVYRKSQLLFDTYASGSISSAQFNRLNELLRAQIDTASATVSRLGADVQEGANIDAVYVLKTVANILLSTNSPDVDSSRRLLEALIAGVFVESNGLRIAYHCTPC